MLLERKESPVIQGSQVYRKITLLDEICSYVKFVYEFESTGNHNKDMEVHIAKMGRRMGRGDRLR